MRSSIAASERRGRRRRDRRRPGCRAHPLLAALLLLCVVVAGRTAHADDDALAESEFQEARRLAKEQRYAEACPRFEASNRLRPSLGALLNLAICHERIGRTASAHTEYRAAAELARQRADSRERIARAGAEAIEPRLTRLRVDAAEPSTPGLVVRRGPTDISQLLGIAIAVDPGDHDIEASAPGRVTWITTVQVSGEGRTIVVRVPPLLETPRAIPTPRVSEETPLHPPYGAADETAAARPAGRGLGAGRVGAIAIGSAAALSFAGAIGLELSGLSTLDRAKQQPASPERSALWNDANRRHQGAQGLAGLGLALAGTTIYLWVSGGAEQPADGTRPVRVGVSVTPSSLLVRGQF